MWYGDTTRLAPARFNFTAGVLGRGAADDEQIRPQHTRAQHGVDVLRIRADRGDQPSRPRDAGPCQDALRRSHPPPVSARRRLSPDRCARVPVDDDERHRLPQQLLRDNAADTAVSAEDEVIVE